MPPTLHQDLALDPYMTSLTDPAPPLETTFERRSRRLAAGLLGLGIEKHDVLAVLCCDEHALDQAVVEAAGVKLSCSVVILSAMSDDIFKTTLTELRPEFLLACPDGTARWQQTGVPCRVIGDEGAMLWWKALELQAPWDEVSAQGSARSVKAQTEIPFGEVFDGE